MAWTLLLALLAAPAHAVDAWIASPDLPDGECAEAVYGYLHGHKRPRDAAAPTPLGSLAQKAWYLLGTPARTCADRARGGGDPFFAALQCDTDPYRPLPPPSDAFTQALMASDGLTAWFSNRLPTIAGSERIAILRLLAADPTRERLYELDPELAVEMDGELAKRGTARLTLSLPPDALVRLDGVDARDLKEIPAGEHVMHLSMDKGAAWTALTFTAADGQDLLLWSPRSPEGAVPVVTGGHLAHLLTQMETAAPTRVVLHLPAQMPGHPPTWAVAWDPATKALSVPPDDHAPRGRWFGLGLMTAGGATAVVGGGIAAWHGTSTCYDTGPQCANADIRNNAMWAGGAVLVATGLLDLLLQPAPSPAWPGEE